MPIILSERKVNIITCIQLPPAVNGTFSSESLLQWFIFWTAASSNITLNTEA